MARCQDCEDGIPLEYLAGLDTCYGNFLRAMSTTGAQVCGMVCLGLVLGLVPRESFPNELSWGRGVETVPMLGAAWCLGGTEAASLTVRARAQS